jgi:rare lipoprotein A (peptidoglycan hydrolase)
MLLVPRRHTLLVVSALAALTLSAGASAAHAQPSQPETPTALRELDDATAEAVELEDRINELQAERVAIDTRLDVLDERIAAQEIRLERSREELDETRATYGDRIVSMYKHGTANPLLLLLQATSWNDLIARSTLLGRIVDQDRDLWKATAAAAAEEHFQAQVLEDLEAQERELGQINDARVRTLERSLARQRELVDQLSQEAEAYLAQIRARNARTRQDWVNSSLDPDAEIEFVSAVVEPYEDRAYLVPSHQPDRYRTTGQEEVMVCSWYGNEFHGRTTASGQVFNENDFTCASRTLPFGTRLALTRSGKRIVVVVTDRGPFIAGRDLDLSKAAAYALGFSGVEPVHAEFVEIVSGPSES